jgi:DNA-binding transcriptional LysR family regulator
MEMIRSALLNGTGIGTIPDFLANEHLVSGSLQAILKGYLIAPDQMSMVWPSSRQLSQKIRVFVDFIGRRLEEEVAATHVVIAK